MTTMFVAKMLISARHSVDENIVDDFAAIRRHTGTSPRMDSEKLGDVLQCGWHFWAHIAALMEAPIPLVLKELWSAFDYTADYLLDSWGHSLESSLTRWLARRLLEIETSSEL
jgi:hypothetical protein